MLCNLNMLMDDDLSFPSVSVWTGTQLGSKNHPIYFVPNEHAVPNDAFTKEKITLYYAFDFLYGRL